jgi:hypothetical protein
VAGGNQHLVNPVGLVSGERDGVGFVCACHATEPMKPCSR